MLDFKTKEEYLAWVKEWRAEYKALSAEIRELKSNRKEYIWLRRPKGITTVQSRTKVGPNPNYSSDANWRVSMKRETAAQLMELRNESKIRAAEQMELSKKAA